MSWSATGTGETVEETVDNAKNSFKAAYPEPENGVEEQFLVLLEFAEEVLNLHEPPFVVNLHGHVKQGPEDAFGTTMGVSMTSDRKVVD